MKKKSGGASASTSRKARRKARGRVVVVTGMSGAGRSTALKALEDIGFEAVDNLPLSLLANLVGPGSGLDRPLAVGVDIRTRGFDISHLAGAIEALRARRDIEVKSVFLDCDDEVLGRRYAETRHRHPLAADRPVADGIRHERRLLTPLKAYVDAVIDTSDMSPGMLRERLLSALGLAPGRGVTIFVTSFSYRFGLPRESDLVFDVRFLSNPHYRAKLQPLTGRDKKVAAFISADPGFRPFFASLTSLLLPLLPRFEREGKSYLTIAIGCTGGRHRSVFVAEKLGSWLHDRGQRVTLHHRDVNRIVAA
ncbi:MAG TPA: RNase adapter RapZ [Alphaproteobacteria bacterium]|nr:RNase adapter RapZ [Alphaproteobacteria bacterium]